MKVFIAESMSKYVDFDKSSRNSTFDRDILPGGPVTASYEKYIHNIFRPGNRLPKPDGVSFRASTMLRMQDLLGSSALDESCEFFSSYYFHISQL